MLLQRPSTSGLQQEGSFYLLLTFRGVCGSSWVSGSSSPWLCCPPAHHPSQNGTVGWRLSGQQGGRAQPGYSLGVTLVTSLPVLWPELTPGPHLAAREAGNCVLFSLAQLTVWPPLEGGVSGPGSPALLHRLTGYDLWHLLGAHCVPESGTVGSRCLLRGESPWVQPGLSKMSSLYFSTTGVPCHPQLCVSSV